MKILLTGGAGFIGSAVARHLINETAFEVVIVDKLTYAGNLDSLAPISASDRYSFELVDICDVQALDALFAKYCPDAVMHLAAESHVDRSIDGPADFIQTNIIGTYALLQTAKKYWLSLDAVRKEKFRFHHVSTDEVYGDLEGPNDFFREDTAYAPSSPYSASKAASDHLVRAWGRTFGLPVILTNCSNNYGPFQFPEKLIPLVILNALAGKPLPVYGSGTQVRDWLFVDDHAQALMLVASNGNVGETYNIGGHNEKQNIEVVRAVCRLLDELRPSDHSGVDQYEQLITFVEDRPGHDVRYAIDSSKLKRDLGWSPNENFESGLRKTVEWYLINETWWKSILRRGYKGQRLGVSSGG